MGTRQPGQQTSVCGWGGSFPSSVRHTDCRMEGGLHRNRFRCHLCQTPALSQMGYNLSPQFTQLLVSRYCPRSANPAMQLDRFIQVCTQLQVLTEAFREKDTAVQGNIRLSFEDFVTMTASRML